jgi:hypothetical protein
LADVDFAKCDQPDELIELAWNAGLDKKAIIREGSDAARLLLAGERNEIVTLFWPVPRPLEAVDRWSENTYSQVSEGLRPFASAVVPGCALGYFITSFFFAPRMSEGSGLTAMVWIIVASIVPHCADASVGSTSRARSTSCSHSSVAESWCAPRSCRSRSRTCGAGSR